MILIADYFKAVKLTKQIRESRASGKDVRIATAIPVIQTGYWNYTMESTYLTGKTRDAVQAVFYGFDEATQHALTFTPSCAGGWSERARFWKNMLAGALPTKMYHDAMLVILAMYIRNVNIQRGGKLV